MPEKIYREALEIAEKKAFKKKETELRALTLSPNALSEETMIQVLGRFYKKGDAWDVAVWQFRNSQFPMPRREGDPKQSQVKIEPRGLFHYEVLSVDTSSPSGATTLRISEKPSSEFKPVDSLVSYLTLTLDGQFKQIKKSYAFKQMNEKMQVSPEGLRSAMTPLELLPLDVPEITTADQKKLDTMPTFPSEIQSFMDRKGIKPDFSQSIWFEQDDFFGRPIQALWQKGDPWPTYLKVPYGIAILIHKRTL